MPFSKKYAQKAWFNIVNKDNGMWDTCLTNPLYVYVVVDDDNLNKNYVYS